MNNWLAYCILLLAFQACEIKSHESAHVQGTAHGSGRDSMIKASIEKSKAYTLAIIDLMPDSLMGYRPTEEVMSFSQHFRHSAFFTCSQLANRAGFENPYEEYRPKVDLDREGLLKEVNRMYAYMEMVLDSMADEQLEMEVEFGKDGIPAWKLFDIVENHIIHHRGACIVYLRMNGITPIGYFGY